MVPPDPSIASPNAPTIPHVKEMIKCQIPNKPSLRPTAKCHEDENILKTTPEFRAHIGRKLTEILDRTVCTENCISSDIAMPQPTEDESEIHDIKPSPGCVSFSQPSHQLFGILQAAGVSSRPCGILLDMDVFRLFSTSVPGEVKLEPVTKRSRLPSSSSDSSDDERFECCAVSGDSIIEQSGLPITSTKLLSASTGSNRIQKNNDNNENIVLDKDIEVCKPKKSKKKKKELGEKCGQDGGVHDGNFGKEHKKCKNKKKREKEISCDK